MESPLINQCQGDRKVLLNALKAIGNSGVFSNEDAIRSCLVRNDEVAVEAVNAMRRTECNDFRFSQLTLLVGNTYGDLEVRQNAYLRAWDCPSIELSHFSEGQMANEPSDNFKNLMYSHAVFETATAKIVLLQGVAAMFNPLDYSIQKSFIASISPINNNGLGRDIN